VATSAYGGYSVAAVPDCLNQSEQCAGAREAARIFRNQLFHCLANAGSRDEWSNNPISMAQK
jgi:hypothetical protein